MNKEVFVYFSSRKIKGDWKPHKLNTTVTILNGMVMQQIIGYLFFAFLPKLLREDW